MSLYERGKSIGKPELGVSLYLSDFIHSDREEWLAYLQDLKGNGISEVFTSLHIPEEVDENYCSNIAEMLQVLKDFRFSVIADVAPLFLDMNQAMRILKDGQIKAARIDFGLDIAQQCALAKKVPICLNASLLMEAELIALGKNLALDEIMAIHNFYPQEETGLSSEFMQYQDQMLRHYGLKKIASFIPGNKHRGPVFKGLCTLEEHRHSNRLFSLLDLAETYRHDHVFLADPLVSLEVLQPLVKYLCYDIITLPVTKCITGYMECSLKIRYDQNDASFRIGDSRPEIVNIADVDPTNTIARKICDITMTNNTGKRYVGELKIIKKNLAKNHTENVIAHVEIEQKNMIALLKHHHKIQLQYQESI